METKPFRLLSCTLLLFLLNSMFIVLIHAHEPSPMSNFLNSLNETKKGDSTKSVSQLKHYLSNLGYMYSSNTHNNTFDDSLEKAIRKYQNFFKLVETGTLDASTVKHMSKPRCGFPDFPRHSSPIEEPHYTFFPRIPKWDQTHLTYSFLPGTRSDTYQAIRAALNLWSSVSPLTFSYTRDYYTSDIQISFQVGDHGDGNPFDINILAHAFRPTDGRLHFNADHNWVHGVVSGAYDLQTVGLHELGHILGLDHSINERAIMAPSLDTGLRKGLDLDDIEGIKTLYSL